MPTKPTTSGPARTRSARASARARVPRPDRRATLRTALSTLGAGACGRAELRHRAIVAVFPHLSGRAGAEVIEHVQEPEALLRETWRVLAPGGLLVVSTPARFTERPIDAMHVQEWFPEEFRRFCADALGTPVALALTHPVALFELYTTSRAAIRRPFRLVINALSKCGVDAFGMSFGFHTFACQIASARKPAPAA